jgi:predicted transcriptional regulator
MALLIDDIKDTMFAQVELFLAIEHLDRAFSHIHEITTGDIARRASAVLNHRELVTQLIEGINGLRQSEGEIAERLLCRD